MSEPLARGVIEIGVDEMKLRDEVAAGQSVVARSFQDSLKRTRIERAERQKLFDLTKSLTYLDTNRVKLQATEKTNRSLRQQLTTLKEINKEGRLSPEAKKVTGYKYTGVADYKPSITAPQVGTGLFGMLKTAGVIGAAGTGLTFAAASAAGSTTLDTLTGSIKMLSLAAGAKTQNAVLSVSRLLQSLAKAVDNAPSGTVGATAGGLTGALVGGRVFGLPGAIIGGLGAAAVGGTVDKVSGDFSEIRQNRNKLLRDPNEINKIIGEMVELQKHPMANAPFGLGAAFGPDIEIAKRRAAIRTSENARRRGDKGENDDFKLAGLKLPVSYSTLGDMRQQMQAGVFATSPLEMANTMRDLKNSIDALASTAKEELALKQAEKPANVNLHPPGN